MATAKIDHVAIRVPDFDWHLNFFRNVLGMEITLTDPEGFDILEGVGGLATEGLNQIWVGGIQLQRAEVSDACEGGALAHIGVAVPNDGSLETILNRVYSLDGIVQVGGKPRNWFVLPSGIMIELVSE